MRWSTRWTAAATALIAALLASSFVGAERATADDPAPVQAELYVSPTGDDANPGTLALPFATVQRAQQAVEAIDGDMTGDIIVYLRGGTYTQSATWSLGAADSGTNGYSVVYSAYDGEKPVISGGRTISGWTLNAATGIYSASAPGLETRQLFVNGARAVRARTEVAPTNAVKTTAGYTTDDVSLAGLAHPEKVEAVFHAAWTAPIVGVQSIAAQSGKAAITLNPALWPSLTNRSRLELVYLENALEFLDQPGEWYLDDTAGTLYYKPRPGEDMSTAVVTAPVVQNLVTVQGSDLATPASDIRFEGITFADSSWTQPTVGGGWLDDFDNYNINGTMPPAAVTLQYTHGVTFERDDFTRLGATGVNLLTGTQDTLIQGNRFFDISGSAINAGPSTKQDASIYNPSDSRAVQRNNDVLDNYIHDVGVQYLSSSAVNYAFPEDADISHNEIFNVPYAGISFFGSTYAPVTITKNVKVQDNFIHDLMNQGIFDGGAIYAFGVTGGTAAAPNIISGNYIKNQHERYATIYMDQSSDYWQIEQNVVDLSQVPIWGDVNSVEWGFLNVKANHVTFDDNYTTTSNFLDNSGSDTNVRTNEHDYPDADWPTAGQTIADAAGLEPAYQDLAAGTLEILDMPSEVDLQTGGTKTLDVEANTGRGDPIDVSSAVVHYLSSGPSVATVSSTGGVTAVASGHAAITVFISFNGALLRKVVDVYVDDTLDPMEVAYSQEKVKQVLYGSATFTPGDARQLIPRGVTVAGRTLVDTPVSIATSDPSVVSVVNGQMTTLAPGTATLTFTATLNGSTLSEGVDIHVVDFSDSSSLSLPALSLNKAIRDPQNWASALPTGSVVPGVDSLAIDTPGNGYAMYTGQTFGDQLLSMNVKIDANSGWPSLVLRAQKPDEDFTAADNSLYMLCIKSNSIELHRFSGGQRTVFFGEIAGSPTVGAASYPNTAIPWHETHLVQFGAVNETGGVRLVLNVDGVNVFTFLDTSADRITGDGYFGVYARDGQMTLSATDTGLPGEGDYPPAQAPTADLAAASHVVNGPTLTVVGTTTPNTLPGKSLSLASASVSYDPAVFDIAALESRVAGLTVTPTVAGGTIGLSFSGTGAVVGGYNPLDLFAVTLRAKATATASAVTLSSLTLMDGTSTADADVGTAKSVAVTAPVTGGVYETFDGYPTGAIAGTSGYSVSPSAGSGYFTVGGFPSAVDKSLHLGKTTTSDDSPTTLSKTYSSAGVGGHVRLSYQVMKESGVSDPQSFVNVRDTSSRVAATVIVDSAITVQLGQNYTLVSAADMQAGRWYEVVLDLDYTAHTASVQVTELGGAGRTWTQAAAAMQNTAATNVSKLDYVVWNSRTAGYSYDDLAIEPV
ncbi:MAG: Ig-like domain-containing protein [Humibacter sp.]